MTDEQVIEIATRAKNGAKVERLLGGDDHDYRSHFEADMALVGILACYSQDPVQLLRLWQGSGLNRPKAHRPDYVRRTIRLAIANRRFTYEPQ
jgi:putative DNA primase/helicase